MSSRDLENKVTFVTGAASGIGLATALMFARERAKVIVADRSHDAGSQVARSIVDGGGAASFVPVDIADSASVAEAIDEVVRRHGRIDVAVNNAGLASDNMVTAELNEETWTRLMSVNLTGTAFCLTHELRLMVEQGGGSIVNVSSATAFRAFPGTGAYAAAKMGIEALTRVAALENGEHGIRVNTVAPGPVRTPLAEASLRAMGTDAESFITSVGVLRRLAEPDEVADAITWIASDRASYVTGTTLHVDGGYLA